MAGASVPEATGSADDRSQKAKIWAYTELLEFECRTYPSALRPAAFERVEKQLKAISLCVDEILVYQYLGQTQ